MDKSGEEFELFFGNDWSTDETLDALQRIKADSVPLRILNVSRQFGKEAATTAGIDH